MKTAGPHTPFIGQTHYARSQGRVGGRPSVMTVERIAEAERMRADRQSWESIGRVLGVGASSVRRALIR